ncbi:hypothetical protein [Streptomyces sp. NPDC048392]|uniref:hypothetical protein n=1 Tax=Streptomyces sp. NPDC048392 TaxID=3365543 RepID=UPI00371A7D2C
MANFRRRRADKRLLGEQNHTYNAAQAFQDAMYALGAAMVQDYRAGKSEEEIVKQAAFTLSETDGRRCCTPPG